MTRRPAGPPRVLSIAGSDPSGGAGIQADLKSISAVGGYGLAAITALTAQHTRGVTGVHVPPAAFLAEQLAAISDDIALDAVKVGMLANADVVRTVGDWLVRERPPVVVVDPVMVATSGDRLLDAAAEQEVHALLRLADLVTPNLQELAVLVGSAPAADPATMIDQARGLAAELGVRVLAKGGHFAGEASDALVAPDGSVVEFRGPRIATTATHGTGCSLSSAVATLRVVHGDWEPAIREARRWLREALRHGEELGVGGGHGPVHHFAGLWARGGIATAPTPAEVEAEWWAELAEVRAAIGRTPFVRELADGTLPRDEFLRYLAEDARYLGDYARVLAGAAALAPAPAEQAFWAASAQSAIDGELAAHEARLAAAGGRPEATADAATVAYTDHLLATVARGEYPVVIAALLPCFQLYADLGERLAAGEFGAAALAAEHPYADWIAAYADAGFAEVNRRAVALVAEAASAAPAGQRERMREAFLVSARHELAFFAAPTRGRAGAPGGEAAAGAVPEAGAAGAAARMPG